MLSARYPASCVLLCLNEHTYRGTCQRVCACLSASGARVRLCVCTSGCLCYPLSPQSPCPMGHYCMTPDSISMCPYGTYNPHWSQSDPSICWQCDDGYFCPLSNTTFQVSASSSPDAAAGIFLIYCLSPFLFHTQLFGVTLTYCYKFLIRTDSGTLSHRHTHAND